jgi:hypothetical protein
MLKHAVAANINNDFAFKATFKGKYHSLFLINVEE